MVKSSAKQLDLIFGALSDSTRRAILKDVSKRELTISEIAKPHEMSMAAISKHLKVLERADLIHKRKEGSFYLVKLNSKNLRSAEQWISYYQRFWDQKLDALAKQLEG